MIRLLVASVWLLGCQLFAGEACNAVEGNSHGQNSCVRHQVAATLPGARNITELQQRLENQAKLCYDTQGTWHEGYASCHCPPDRLFEVENGCVALVALQTIKQCASKLLYSETPCQSCRSSSQPIQVALDLSKLDAASATSILQEVTRDAAYPFRGHSILANDIDGTYISARLIDKVAFNSHWLSLTESAYFISQPGATLTSAKGSRDAWAKEDVASTCGDTLRDSEGSRFTDQQFESSRQFVCQSLESTLKDLDDASQGLTGLGFEIGYHDEGQDCMQSCVRVHTKTLHGYAQHYDILMNKYVPNVRHLEIAGPLGVYLEAFLSPNGKIEAVYFERIFNKPEQGIMGEKLVYKFGTHWNEIDLRNEAGVAYADLWTMSRTAAVKDSQKIGIEAGMIDVSIHVHDTDGWQYLQRRQAGDPGHDFPSLEAEFARLASYERNAEARMFEVGQCTHGSRVAATMLKEIVAPRLSFLPGSDLTRYGPSGELLHQWSKFLNERQPRVVNISMLFGRGVPNCHEFFGKLFQDHPKTLFVAAAGNSGLRDPVGECPVGLAYLYDNFITVAGTNEDGSLHHASTYGVDTAMIAAPMEVMVPAIDRDGYVRESGTSFASPAIANAALRLFVKHPHLEPADAITLLMSCCRPNHIAVGCGGGLDVERFNREVIGE